MTKSVDFAGLGAKALLSWCNANDGAANRGTMVRRVSLFRVIGRGRPGNLAGILLEIIPRIVPPDIPQNYRTLPTRLWLLPPPLQPEQKQQKGRRRRSGRGLMSCKQRSIRPDRRLSNT